MRNDMNYRRVLAGIVPAVLAAGLFVPERAQGIDPKVREAEKRRAKVIADVSPSVVAVMARGLGGLVGNGSGVLIDEEGYALTNFHVTSAAGSALLKCGLPDGKVYDAVLVGQDKVGDVALIKLLPKKAGDKFPFAKLGDSDKARAGDWSLAMGNPFSLATDFTPTVTFGLISGVHRYQYPAGTLLEYTDCIQIDTSINPGNSGGPLFNADGELIGINGRGSFEKRGRVNSGVGYAISINQIKNFMGQLRVGLDCDHASLGAQMVSESEEGELSRILVQSIIDSDARRRGLDVGDQLVSFAGRPMTTVNQYKNVLGLYPRGWRLPMVYRHENKKSEVLVRLMGVQRQALDGTPTPQPGPRPRPRPRPGPPGPPSPAAKLYKFKAGFTNYYFNEQAQQRLLAEFKKYGDFSKKTGDWTLLCKGTLSTGGGKGKDCNAAFNIQDKGGFDKKSPRILAEVDAVDFALEPLRTDEKADRFKEPIGSGGLLLAVYQYRQLLVYGPKGFQDFSHGGTEPYYAYWSDGEKPEFGKLRVEAEVINTKHAGVPAKWYFAAADDKAGRWKKGQLIGFEVAADRDDDPCEVCLSGYKDTGDGTLLPHRIEVRKGDRNYGSFNVTSFGVK
jgi:S1-C subfamily serine protease